MGLQNAALRQPSVAGAPLIMSPQRGQTLSAQLPAVSAAAPQLNQQLLAQQQQLLMGIYCQYATRKNVLPTGTGMDLATQQMLLGNLVQPDAAALQQQALMAQVSMANAQFMPQLGVGYEQTDLKCKNAFLPLYKLEINTLQRSCCNNLARTQLQRIPTSNDRHVKVLYAGTLTSLHLYLLYCAFQCNCMPLILRAKRREIETQSIFV